MSDTLTALPRDPSVGIHPRFLNRLEDTLSCRLRAFEASRHRARQLLTEVRNRVSYLEDNFGMPLAECRTACDALLETIDGLDAQKTGGGVDPELLSEQVASLTALTGELNPGIATRGSLVERSTLSQIAQPSAGHYLSRSNQAR